jgi:hypothetical protein
MPVTADGRKFAWCYDPATGQRFRLFTAGLDTASTWPDDDDQPAEVIRVPKDELEDDEPSEPVQ